MTRPGVVHLDETTARDLVCLLVEAVIEDDDTEARRLLDSCWPETDWDAAIAACRAELAGEEQP